MLGGAHHFYSTYIHEKIFSWNEVPDVFDPEDYEEISHILIETDGDYFRIVEVSVGYPNLNQPRNL